jgi:hypothetical protein
MPDTEEQQYIQFKRWLQSPGALPAQPAAQDAPASLQKVIEDGLWAAWQAGYKEGLQQQRP